MEVLGYILATGIAGVLSVGAVPVIFAFGGGMAVSHGRRIGITNPAVWVHKLLVLTHANIGVMLELSA